MANLLPPEEFVKIYLERGLLPENIVVKHSITGEILPEAQITPLYKIPADELRVYIKDEFYDPFVIKEMLGPTRDVLREEAKKRRVFTRIAPLCRATKLSTGIICERVPYHYIRLIHSNADFVLRERGLYSPMRLRDALRSLVVRKNKLVPLEKSVLPNALSVHIFLVAKDGAAVFVRRSPRLSIAANTLSVIEGYVEADRDNTETTGEELAFIELEDEAGLKKGEVDLVYVAGYRSLRTLGRPMAMFFGIYSGNSEELARRIKEVSSWEHAGIEVIKLSESAKDIDDFYETLDRSAIESLSKRPDLSPTLKIYTHILGSIARSFCIRKEVEKLRR